MAHRRHVPVIKNGQKASIYDLEQGDVLIIESAHLIPQSKNVYELTATPSVMIFEELRSFKGNIFIWGRGLAFDFDLSSIEMSAVNTASIKKIIVINALDMIKSILAQKQRIILLTENKKDLEARNAQLVASHFINVSDLKH